jgi:hypothetical protein
MHRLWENGVKEVAHRAAVRVKRRLKGLQNNGKPALSFRNFCLDGTQCECYFCLFTERRP